MPETLPQTRSLANLTVPSYMRGFRYNIEQVDLAIMKDMGLSVGDGWMTA